MPNILMPALSPTMEEGKLSKWLVKEGDTVNPGDVLAEIETDKATMEVESVDSGKVTKLLIPEGTEGVKVNTPIAIVLGEGETPGEEMPKPPAATPAPSMVAAEAPAPAPAEAKAPATAAAPTFTPAADPDLPDGVEMVEMTVRQALNEAMAEEMRRDPDIFLMGEEVAEYNGAYKVSQGLLDEFGAKRVVDTPITEHAFAGVDVELIDLRTLRPMDSATVIESVRKTGRLVTVEEGWPQGGIGAELAARVTAEAFDYLDAPPTRVTGKDVPMPYAANLEKLALPSVDDVVAAVNAVTYRS
jgi:hypothetical protein